jgi:hypothetical protein
LFNLLGWIWKKTLKANLILLLLTGSSWFILGIWYGIGYCPLTDWHWEALRELGYNNLPNSYVNFLLERTTGILLKPGTVDIVVVAAYFISLSISIYLNLKKNKGENITTLS